MSDRNRSHIGNVYHDCEMTQPPGMNLETKDVPLTDLHCAQFNPRLIRDKRFSDLKRSMDQDHLMMQARPLIALPDGTVICGNMRLRAAQELHWESIPTVYADLDERRAREWMLRDNNAFGEWQDDQLAELVYELHQSGTELDTLGFDDDRLKELLDSVGALGETAEDPGAQMDRAEELREQWGTEQGQLWTIGKHRLLCGDSTNADDVARLMGGERAALLVTSPPYGVGKEYESGGLDEWELLISDTFSIWAPLVPWATVNLGDVKCGPDHREVRTYSRLVELIESFGLPCVGTRVWVKQPAWSQGPYWLSSYRSVDDFEYVGIFGEGKHSKRVDDDWVYRGVWDFASVQANKDHPAQFPPELPSRCMRLLTDSDSLVIEPFLGSGTTMVAAEQNGRRCYGMEIEPKYVAVALQRLADMGLEPKLQESTPHGS